MRHFAVISGLVVIIALALSFLLLPSQKELGTMLLRDREYEASRQYFEAQLASGDQSPQVITALLEIYIQNGDVDRAIALVGSYEEAIGTAPDVLQRLTELYRQDRRFGLYLHTLERLAAIAPTATRVEELADAYYKAGRTEKQIAALVWLSSFPDVSAARQLELADLQVASGRYEEAVRTLAQILEKTPDALDASYERQLFDLSLYLDDHDLAKHVADTVLGPSTPGGRTVTFASVALYRRAPDLALTLLERRAEQEAVDPQWRRTHADVLLALGRDDDAWSELSYWWSADLLPPASAPTLIDLALVRADLATALGVFNRYGIDRIGASATLSLIGELHRAGRDDDVDAILAEIGIEALNDEPILGADIMLTRGDVAEAARLTDLALTLDLSSIAVRVALADVLSRQDRNQAAFELLHPYIADPVLPVEGAVLLAELYVRLDKAEEGFWDVAALLAQRSTPRLRALWAQLGLVTGRMEMVAEWLAREPVLSATTAIDLYFLGERQSAWGVALAAARRLQDLEPGPATTQKLAYALHRLGEDREALEVIRPLASQETQLEPLYGEILQALGETEELKTLWSRQMSRPELSEAEREALVYNLLEVGADEVVWDQLLLLAESKGGQWWYTAAGAAQRLDRVAELSSLAQQRLGVTDPDSEEATAMVYAIADADRSAALPLFRRLAELDPVQWEDAYIATLRDLGRRQDLIDWTTARLNRVTDTQKILALAYGLAELDPAAAAKAVQTRATDNRQLADLYADLLRRSGRRDKAYAFEMAQAENGRFGDVYTRETAFRALESGDRPMAEKLFRRVAAEAGPDSEAMRQLYYLWGPRPRSDALDWIEARARVADGSERDKWIDKLVEMRAAKRVETLIGGLDGAKSDRDLLHLVRAYAQGDQRPKLREAIIRAISRIKETEQLRSLARTAETTRDRSLITATWQAVLAAAPSDSEAQRTLGLIAYDEGRLIDAERLLGAYLANGDGDYEANYYYADTLARTDRSAQAMPFYRRAYEQLLRIDRRDFTQEVARANLLRQLGRTEDAVQVMNDLVRQRPGDDGLRADFADLLIETGDLQRARQILKLK